MGENLQYVPEIFSFTRTEGLSFPRRGKLKLAPSVPVINSPRNVVPRSLLEV
jgi:hypothetical protein